jgi:hypothetical protein
MGLQFDIIASASIRSCKQHLAGNSSLTDKLKQQFISLIGREDLIPGIKGSQLDFLYATKNQSDSNTSSTLYTARSIRIKRDLLGKINFYFQVVPITKDVPDFNLIQDPKSSQLFYVDEFQDRYAIVSEKSYIKYLKVIEHLKGLESKLLSKFPEVPVEGEVVVFGNDGKTQIKHKVYPGGYGNMPFTKEADLQRRKVYLVDGFMERVGVMVPIDKIDETAIRKTSMQQQEKINQITRAETELLSQYPEVPVEGEVVVFGNDGKTQIRHRVYLGGYGNIPFTKEADLQRRKVYLVDGFMERVGVMVPIDKIE